MRTRNRHCLLLVAFCYFAAVTWIDCTGVFTGNAVLAQEQLPQDNLAKWKSMSREERERLRQNYSIWKNFSATDKQKLSQKLHDFKRLSRDDQKRVRDNFRTL